MTQASSNPKVAIVTGAATGIGKASAIALSRDGYSVVLNYRSRDRQMASVMSELSSGDHLSIRGDISRPDEVNELVEETVSRFGRIDVVVNAAGVFSEHELTTVDYQAWQASWEENISVNLLAPMNVSFCAAQHMLKARSGKIINITSRGAFRGEPDAPAYGASKSGLNSASQSLARALGPHGISVYAIAPGWVNTPLAEPYLQGAGGDAIRAQSPLGRVAEPEEIAHIVAFLARDGCEYMTGSIIDANGASFFRN